MERDALKEERRRLFAGLYEPSINDEEAPPVPRAPSPVRLLNPASTDEDATARRFSLLEID